MTSTLILPSGKLAISATTGKLVIVNDPADCDCCPCLSCPQPAPYPQTDGPDSGTFGAAFTHNIGRQTASPTFTISFDSFITVTVTSIGSGSGISFCGFVIRNTGFGATPYELLFVGNVIASSASATAFNGDYTVWRDIYDCDTRELHYDSPVGFGTDGVGTNSTDGCDENFTVNVSGTASATYSGFTSSCNQ